MKMEAIDHEELEVIEEVTVKFELNLSKGIYKTLLYLIDGKQHRQGNKTFCKQDNTFTTINVRELEKFTTVSKSAICRLMKELKEKNLIKEVVNNVGDTVWMLSPFFLSNTSHSYKLIFKKAMFALGSHEKAIQWGKDCRSVGKLLDWDSDEVIDMDTGEITPRKALKNLSFEFCREWYNYVEDNQLNDSDVHFDYDASSYECSGLQYKNRVNVNTVKITTTL